MEPSLDWVPGQESKLCLENPPEQKPSVEKVPRPEQAPQPSPQWAQLPRPGLETQAGPQLGPEPELQRGRRLEHECP